MKNTLFVVLPLLAVTGSFSGVYANGSAGALHTATTAKKRLREMLSAMRRSGQDLNLSELSDVSMRLHELNPENQDFARFAAVMRAFILLADPSNRGNLDRWKSAEALLERAERLNPRDQDIAELRIMVKSAGFSNLDVVAEEVRALEGTYGDAGIVDYYSAFVEWKNGRKERAKVRLRSAIRKQPKNERFAMTLRDLERAKDTEELVFEFSPAILMDGEV